MAETETKSNSGILLALLIGGGLLLMARKTKAAPAPAPAVKAAAIAVLVPGTVTKNNAPATTMPTLPPGTTPAVVAAVQKAFAEGTLTVGQAAAVSQLYAPLYYGTGSVEFGTKEAAQAALDAYMNNFAEAAPAEEEVNPNNQPATEMPTLPPGTSPAVAEAVEDAFNAGTLTQGQADAASELYAPMYQSDGSVDFGTTEAAQAALDAYMANFV